MACDIIIIGGEGDLAFRKLYPALFSLDCEGLLADSIKIIAFARGKYDADAFYAAVRLGIENSDYTAKIQKADWGRFTERLIQFVGDATSAASFVTMQGLLKNEERVIYLSTPPSIFSPICLALDEAGLVDASTRIVIEKPLGESQASFEQIDEHVQAVFEEHQIYRIDHYLGKETVQNLLALRFANVLFEPLWNRNYIDHVQITVAEQVGVGGRWSFYDSAGALRDMVQNHMLQLLCLVTMEPPAKNTPDFVRDEKLKILRCLRPIERNDVNHVTVRGQYAKGQIQQDAAPGYLEEADAKGNSSSTETFVAIKAEIENSRWNGVPFYLRTGKRMRERYSEIMIQFKPVVHRFFDSNSGRLTDNQLIIRLQPNEGIEMKLVHKVPGLTENTRLKSVGLDLSFDEAFGDHRSPSAYERLILDVIRSDQTLFIRSDELLAAWEWIDRIIDGWEQTGKQIAQYAAGSWGPSESVDLLARDRRRWFDYDDNR